MSDTKYILTMTDDQAKVIARACDFYARILLGQFDEIVWETLERSSPFTSDYTERRNKMELLLLQAKECAFPELHGYSHYGVGHDKTSDTAWNAYQAIRYCIAWHNHPEGGGTVDFRKPIDFGNVGIPECIAKDETENC